jgi:hypothetical protein
MEVRPRAPRALRAAVRALGHECLAVRLKAEACLRADRRHAIPLLRRAARLQAPAVRAVRAAVVLHQLEDRDGIELLRRMTREPGLRNSEARDLLRRASREIIGPEFYIRQATAALTRLEQMPESLAAIGRFRQALEILRFLEAPVPLDILRRALVVRTIGGENLSLVRTVLDGTHDICLEHVSMARMAAVEALLHQEDRQRAYTLLSRQLAHPSTAVQITAMYGLERLGDTRAIGPLLPIARDPDSPLCDDARRLLTLLNYGTPDVLTLLRPSMLATVLPKELLRPAAHAPDSTPETLVRPVE